MRKLFKTYKERKRIIELNFKGHKEKREREKELITTLRFIG